MNRRPIRFAPKGRLRHYNVRLTFENFVHFSFVRAPSPLYAVVMAVEGGTPRPDSGTAGRLKAVQVWVQHRSER